MSRFGPSRRELRMRVCISGGGLLAVLVALLHRGWPPGPAMVEVALIGGGFFGLTLASSLRRLLRDRPPDA